MVALLASSILTFRRILITAIVFGCLICSFQATAVYADSPDTSSIIQYFDWRDAHGANDPTSPYYDGDPGGSGWMTPVDTQECHHCWAFSSVHATEAIVNLYYNDHLDIDLSEQEVASCSGGNSSYSCENGGKVYRTDGGSALGYIMEEGVSEEACFPYVGEFPACSEKCPNPEEKIQLPGITALPLDYDQVKLALIQYGPFVGCVDREVTGEDMGHCVVCVGFDQNPVTGEIIWIYKNSYGEDYEEQIDYGPGYGGLPVPLEYVHDLYSLNTPVISMNTSYEVACNDYDEDGYYNWGLSETMPDSCLPDVPPDVPQEKDCDDSDPNRIFRNDNGHCLQICSSQSDCDDGDQCTVDTCTALGCEHERTPGCGDCLSVEGTLAELEETGHVYPGEYGPYEDCSACTFSCFYPWGCRQTVDYYYYAHGSDEEVGSDPDAVVQLTSVENSFVWSTAECDPSGDPCDNVNCDDGNACNGVEVCVGGDCYPGTPLNCDDGAFCNGVETCDVNYGCRPGDDPCAPDETCDEAEDQCIDCLGYGSRCQEDGDCCSNNCSGIFFRRCR